MIGSFLLLAFYYSGKILIQIIKENKYYSVGSSNSRKIDTYFLNKEQITMIKTTHSQIVMQDQNKYFVFNFQKFKVID